MPGNKFRAGTYGINAIPTILRVEEVSVCVSPDPLIALSPLGQRNGQTS